MPAKSTQRKTKPKKKIKARQPILTIKPIPFPRHLAAKMRIFWYQKPDGSIQDESADSAWRIHYQKLSARYGMGYKYLGWSSGQWLNGVRQEIRVRIPNDDNRTLIHLDDLQKRYIALAQKKELEEAALNQQPPPRKNGHEFIGGFADSTIGDPVTQGVDRLIKRR